MRLELGIADRVAGEQDTAGNLVDDIGSGRPRPPSFEEGLPAMSENDKIDFPGTDAVRDQPDRIAAQQLAASFKA